MKITEHLTKAEAFERCLAKLDPLVDGPLYAVFLMRAGTSRVNAALHALGLTADSGPVQPKLGDLNHTYKPPINFAVPAGLKRAFQELAYIENLRPDFVRGATRFDAGKAQRAAAAYAMIKRETEAVLEGVTS